LVDFKKNVDHHQVSSGHLCQLPSRFFVVVEKLLTAISGASLSMVPCLLERKSWKVMELRKEFSRPEKLWKMTVVMESYGKVMEFHQ